MGPFVLIIHVEKGVEVKQDRTTREGLEKVWKKQAISTETNQANYLDTVIKIRNMVVESF